MNAEKDDHVEEVQAEEVEIVSTGHKKERIDQADRIIRVSADEKNTFGKSDFEDPLQKFFESMEEFKKIRIFGILALPLGLIGIIVYPLYLEPIAFLLALLDLWKGSKFTKKVDIAVITIAILALLNAWN